MDENDKCSGWDWFDCDDRMEVQRVDEGAVFADDDEALLHIHGCARCQQKLGKHLADFLIAEWAYGVEPYRPTRKAVG